FFKQNNERNAHHRSREQHRAADHRAVKTCNDIQVMHVDHDKEKYRNRHRQGNAITDQFANGQSYSHLTNMDILLSFNNLGLQTDEGKVHPISARDLNNFAPNPIEEGPGANWVWDSMTFS